MYHDPYIIYRHGIPITIRRMITHGYWFLKGNAWKKHPGTRHYVIRGGRYKDYALTKKRAHQRAEEIAKQILRDTLTLNLDEGNT